MKDEIYFSLKEEEILRILLKNQNTYISAEDIANYINENCWLVSETNRRSIVKTICKINKKLKYTKIIKKSRIGYRAVRKEDKMKIHKIYTIEGEYEDAEYEGDIEEFIYKIENSSVIRIIVDSKLIYINSGYILSFEI